ncbi:hypothetical protein JQR88_10830 [Pseudomonas luteola]|uniref:hypothetical protein n=1 Tax=Pseudomonas luteola TaxID=47886 RepID=UPI003D9FFAE4
MPRNTKRLSSYYSLVAFTLPLIVLATSSISGCNGEKKEYKPASHTDEYRAAHGLEKGKESILTVGNSTFKFPPNFYFEPYTDHGKIIKNRAERIHYSVLLNPKSPKNAPDHFSFRLEIYSLERPFPKGRHLPKELHYVRTSTRTELGLVEYRGDLGMAIFIPIGEEETLGNWISCRSIDLDKGPKAEPNYFGLCSTSYVVKGNLIGKVYFDPLQIRYWREIHTRALESINQYLIN